MREPGLRHLCGLPKRRGAFSTTSSSYDVETVDGKPLLNIRFKSLGSLQSPSAFPHFTALRPLFEQVHMGKLFARGQLLLDAFVCSDADLQLPSSQLQPVEVIGTQDLCPALESRISLPGIDSDPLGAFRVKTTWVMPPPKRCR